MLKSYLLIKNVFNLVKNKILTDKYQERVGDFIS